MLIFCISAYTGKYIYENSQLKQVSHPEGYLEPKAGGGYQYVYRLTDIWGNTRITYADDNGDGVVGASEIRREQNYYPFGLEHRGYNAAMSGVKNNLKTYQGQEFTEDLGLNTHEWKYRVSDPAIGRFWQIDPLAEDYTYNSTYAFQENKLGIGIELEGLEVKKWFDKSPLFRLIVESVSNENQRQAERAAVFGAPDRSGPTKNITGNYFGDAAYKLAGGETISKALAGDTKAQFRVIAGAEVALAPAGKGIGDDVAKNVADDVAKVVGSNTKTGGRLGNATTRAQNSAIAGELEARGYEITGGGGRLPEEYIPPIGGGKKGGSYPDITATKDGKTLRINTVDTRKNGQMTTREATNAARIRAQKPEDHLLTIPKQQ